MLRIIAGEVRGHPLRTPKGRITRPTTDRVREALFNILGSRVIDSIFLDLFAGSGAVGLEALSRGAKKAVFIENNKLALKCLNSNLMSTNFKAKGLVIAADARRALEYLKKRDIFFDLVYVDPPYSKGWGDVILPSVNDLLLPYGLIIMETSVKEKPSEINGIKMFSKRVYGDTALSFYKKAGG